MSAIIWCVPAVVGLLLTGPFGQPSEDSLYPLTETFQPGARHRWHAFAGSWDFQPGSVRQTESNYDCGATLASRPTGPFYLSVRFKPESAFNGGGLFFALPGLDAKNGGMMVRCDPGGRILWGWFDEHGVFNYHADASFDDLGQTEQELAVAVDPVKLGFNIYHNNERIATNVKTYHAEGFVGMQSSGGPHTFTRFEARPATEAELSGIKPPGRYSRIVDVVGNGRCVLALRAAPKFLVRYDEDGQERGQAYVTDVAGLTSADFAPLALAWDAHRWSQESGGVLVLAEKGRAVYHFDGVLRQIGQGPLARQDEMAGRALAVGPGGHIFVADSALPGVRVFDKDGKEVLAFGEKGGFNAYETPSPASSGKFQQPRGIAVGPDGRIVVTDWENCSYSVYRYDPAANVLNWVTNGPWLPHPAAVRFNRQGQLILAGTYEYYRSYGALRVLSLDGYAQRVFVGHSLGDMSDRVRACEGPGGKYYIMDPDKERFIILPPNFVEKMPELAWTNDGGVKLTMTKVDGSAVTTTSNERRPEDGRVVVRQSEPICATWPPVSPEELRSYALPPKPPAGKTYVIDMPVLVAVFTKMSDAEGKETSIGGAGIAERLERELVTDRMFYWLNSHCLLNKQFEFMVIDDVVPQDVGAWITPTEGRRLVNEARARRGLAPIDADHSLVCIHPRAGFDSDYLDDPAFVSGGGLTTYAYSGYTLWNNGQGWLMGHEWGHQLDSYFDRSGLTDWWLNHPDGTVHVGRYGEHWDCNAFLCRRVDRMNWLRFRFGTPRLVDDRDGDGLADDDPSLPLDERRFGSDAGLIDTDGDGLSDFDEAVAGTFTSSDPTSPDTDNDGIDDASDPYPQFAVGTRIGKARRGQGGVPALDSFKLVGEVARGWCEARVFGAYDADHLHLLIGLTKPARQVFATVDFNNDGWFIGRDNIYASVDLEWPADGKPSVTRSSNCDAELLPGGSAVPADMLPYGSRVVYVTVRRPESRPTLEPDSAVGLTVRLQNGGGTVAFLIDPWQILGLELE